MSDPVGVYSGMALRRKAFCDRIRTNTGTDFKRQEDSSTWRGCFRALTEEDVPLLLQEGASFNPDEDEAFFVDNLDVACSLRAGMHITYPVNVVGVAADDDKDRYVCVAAPNLPVIFQNVACKRVAVVIRKRNAKG